jgi:hypothetical protein
VQPKDEFHEADIRLGSSIDVIPEQYGSGVSSLFCPIFFLLVDKDE